MSKRDPERITLFDRVALAVCGAMIGYLSGLALGWASFLFFGALLNLFGPSPVTGKFFFYQVPIAVMAVCSIGCAVLPNQTPTFVARIWHVVVALSKRF